MKKKFLKFIYPRLKLGMRGYNWTELSRKTDLIINEREKSICKKNGKIDVVPIIVFPNIEEKK